MILSARMRKIPPRIFLCNRARPRLLIKMASETKADEMADNIPQQQISRGGEDDTGLLAPDSEEPRPHPSPQLSPRTLDELGQLQTDPDPDNYRLHTPWTFWFERSAKGASTSDFFANLRSIHVVTTIKAFWCVCNNLSPVEQLQDRESYHLMRDTERRPVWEDELNAHGGMWSFKVKKEDTAAVWQEVLLAAIGEQFSGCMDPGDDICGVSVRIRRFDHNVIQIWNTDSEQHSKSSVIQKIKDLIPSIEINEFYKSNRSKVEESLRKPNYGHRKFSPPPSGPGPSQHRFPGPPMIAQFPPYPPPSSSASSGQQHRHPLPPRYPAYPRHHHPPPPHHHHHHHGPRHHHPHHHPPHPPSHS